MISPADFRAAALKMPLAHEKAHFERAGFRVNVPKGKMFCTLAGDRKTVNILLRPEQQTMLCSNKPSMFSPVQNKWGDQGWTVLTLEETDDFTVRSVLRMAWTNAVPAMFHDLLV